MIKPLISLTWKKIWRTAHPSLALLLLSLMGFFYLALIKTSLTSAMETLTMILPYLGLLLTGGLIKDELDSRHLEVILTRTSTQDIIVAKFLTVLAIIALLIIAAVLSGLVLILIKPQDMELVELLNLAGRSLVLSFNLITAGLFLSCWFKGQINFAVLFFTQFAFLIIMEQLGWLNILDNWLMAKNFDLKMLPALLFSPFIIQKAKSLPLILIAIFYALIFLALSYISLKSLGLKKNYRTVPAEEKTPDRCLSIQELSKSYPSGFFRKKKVLYNISFGIGRMRITGFLGPNGAGKTTTLRLIIGYLKPDSGLIEIATAHPGISEKVKIGYLSENPALYPFLKVREILDLVLKLNKGKSPQRETLIQEILNKFGLQEYAEQKIKALSKGNLQKLALVLAVIDDPEIIILDEPYTGLDPIVMNDIRQQIIELEQKGKTIFLSSHLLPEVDRVCDEVILINRGKIIGQGRVTDLKLKWRLFTAFQNNDQLKKQYAQELGIDISRMNFFYFLQNDSEKLLKNSFLLTEAARIPQPELETVFLEAVKSLESVESF